MADPLLRTDKEIAEIYRRHADTIYRLCFSFMKNRADTEDLVQETFLRLMQRGPRLDSPEHEKAWLIVTEDKFPLQRAGRYDIVTVKLFMKGS